MSRKKYKTSTATGALDVYEPKDSRQQQQPLTIAVAERVDFQAWERQRSGSSFVTADWKSCALRASKGP
jgi:hypothetical protein